MEGGKGGQPRPNASVHSGALTFLCPRVPGREKYYDVGVFSRRLIGDTHMASDNWPFRVVGVDQTERPRECQEAANSVERAKCQFRFSETIISLAKCALHGGAVVGRNRGATMRARMGTR